MDFFTKTDTDFFREMILAAQARAVAATRRAVIDVLRDRTPSEVQAALKALIAEEVAQQLHARRLLEEKSAAPGPALSRGDILAEATQIAQALQEYYRREYDWGKLAGAVRQEQDQRAAADVRIALNELTKVTTPWSSGVDSAVQALTRAETSLLTSKV